MLRGDGKSAALPAVADLLHERESEPAREADGPQSGELKGEKAMGLLCVELLDRPESPPQARVQPRLVVRSRELLELAGIETGDLADPVARVDRRLQQPKSFDVRCAVATCASGGAKGGHHAVPPLPGSQQLWRDSREARRGA